MNGIVNFSDILKKSVVNSVVTDLTVGRILLTLALCLVIGCFIYFIYKKTFRGVLYSRSFNISLIAMTMLTAIVIMSVTSNIVLSLGMVGALSIVRFRTAVKEPMDLVFLFWAIGIGIVTGAGLHILAVIGSTVMGFLLVLLNSIPAGDMPFLLMIQAHDEESDSAVSSLLHSKKQRFSLKSKTISPNGIETTYELRLKASGSELINQIATLDGVDNAVLIAYNGDYVA